MNSEFLAIFPIHRLKNKQFQKTAAFEQEGIICCVWCPDRAICKSVMAC